MTPRKITHIVRVQSPFLWLQYESGETLRVGFHELLERAQTASSGPLADFRQSDYLALAQPTEYGTLLWLNGYEACADALYGRGHRLAKPVEASGA